MPRIGNLQHESGNAKLAGFLGGFSGAMKGYAQGQRQNMALQQRQQKIDAEIEIAKQRADLEQQRIDIAKERQRQIEEQQERDREFAEEHIRGKSEDIRIRGVEQFGEAPGPWAPGQAFPDDPVLNEFLLRADRILQHMPSPEAAMAWMEGEGADVLKRIDVDSQRQVMLERMERFQDMNPELADDVQQLIDITRDNVEDGMTMAEIQRRWLSMTEGSKERRKRITKDMKLIERLELRIGELTGRQQEDAIDLLEDFRAGDAKPSKVRRFLGDREEDFMPPGVARREAESLAETAQVPEEEKRAFIQKLMEKILLNREVPTLKPVPDDIRPKGAGQQSYPYFKSEENTLGYPGIKDLDKFPNSAKTMEKFSYSNLPDEKKSAVDDVLLEAAMTGDRKEVEKALKFLRKQGIHISADDAREIVKLKG